MASQAVKNLAKRQQKDGKKKWIQGAHLKEGAFTAYCKRQGYKGVTAQCIAEGKRSNNAHVRKMANLASTFRKMS